MTNWTQLSRQQQIEQLERDWAENPRWKGIKRGYSAADVVRLVQRQPGMRAAPLWCSLAGCRTSPCPPSRTGLTAGS